MACAANDCGRHRCQPAGTLVVAHNLGTFDNASATLNGVTFTPFVTSTPLNIPGNVKMSAASNILGDNFNFGEIVPPFTDLSNDYQTLLQSGSFTSGLFPPPEITLTLFARRRQPSPTSPL